MSLPLNQVITGNCIDVMAEWPENSIDCIVCDPPYGLNFMNLDFDKALPPRAAFEQMIRVLKPGALAFVMSSPRQDVLWRMLSMLEGVGFQLKTSALFWIYRTGFPKSYDVSKGIDQRLLRIRFFDEIRNYLIHWRDKAGLSNSEINQIMGYATTGSGMAGHWFGNITQQTLPTKEQWFRLKELLGFDDEFDSIYSELRDGADRPKIGKNAHWGKNGVLPWHGKEWDVTNPASDLAKQWEGWKSQTGLKPAAEVIIQANKPRSEPTIVDNVLRWGTGAINVDACRIPFQNEGDSQLVESKHDSVVGLSTPRANTYNWRKFEGVRTDGFTPKGRFPANLLVSDKAIDDGTISGSGKFKPSKGGSSRPLNPKTGWNKHSMTRDGKVAPDDYGDIGGKSRYFDLDAWAEHHGFLDVAKPSKAERDFGLNYFQEKQVEQRYGSIQRVKGESFIDPDGKKHQRLSDNIQKRRNTHPTCKPVKLMAYLIELGCPPKGIVVDPFLGSGTTCIAAKKLRRQWIGIEINPEYAEIAEARINVKGPLDQYMETEGR